MSETEVAKAEVIIGWAKSLESRKTYELASSGVNEFKVEKGKGTLKAMRERLDIIKKDAVKHERFRRDNDQAFVQLDKWGFQIPKEERARLLEAGLIAPPAPLATQPNQPPPHQAKK